MRLRVFSRYILVFAVRGKRKFGRFYTPTKGSYADYFQHQTVWMAEFGEDCRIRAEGAAVGRKGYVVDCFELEDVAAELWPTYRAVLPKAVTDEILAEAKEYDGVITANVIHEDSIFALEETERWESLPSTSQP